jgi:phosphoglucosamine mutase
MAQSVFGTDGVRGRANAWPVTPDMALRLGQAAGARFRGRSDRARVVIGKDTRLSGYMLESALQAGFTSAGMDVMLLGPVPTPAVGMLTRSLRADVGVMISASHNPYQDNGVKLFGPDGYKISDEDEAALTAMLDAAPELAPADRIGRAKRIDGGPERYVEFAKATFPRALRLDGLRVALDCANGAAYRTAPTALWELGAEVVPLGVEPNGRNINDRCGSTHPEACRQAVLDRRADIGIALDGDADRVHLIDEKGRLVDGDQLMALIAGRWADEGRLKGGALVATVMSNLGLERWLGGRGLRLERTKVGDRHVIERMRAGGFNVGGEQSGHIVLSDLTTTGDGLIAALQALAAMVETGRRASEVLHLFEPAPQVLRSVRNPLGAAALQAAAVREAIAAAEAALGASGRLLVRPSGTEPVIRVMAEGEDAAQVEQAVAGVAEALARG